MKILAFESTAKITSVAVTDDLRRIAGCDIENGLSQSELLLPAAEALLSASRLTFDDIDLFACTSGPGSFTGVRIGVSVVKGLAFGRNKPCVGVSTLASLAENLRGTDGFIVPCMDARRGQFYSAIFRMFRGELKRVSPDEAIGGDELCKKLSDISRGRKIYVCGDGYNQAKELFSRYGLKTADTPFLLRSESAYSCAAAAYRMFLRGEYVSDVKLSPSYLRLPQAERERLEKAEREKSQKTTII